jgi:hypothetical protein
MEKENCFEIYGRIFVFEIFMFYVRKVRNGKKQKESFYLLMIIVFYILILGRGRF